MSAAVDISASCTGKATFRTHGDATANLRQRARRLRGQRHRSRGAPLWAYRCADCGHWHLTGRKSRRTLRA